jgi:hypothetical protein
METPGKARIVYAVRTAWGHLGDLVEEGGVLRGGVRVLDGVADRARDLLDAVPDEDGAAEEDVAREAHRDPAHIVSTFMYWSRHIN